MKLTTSQHMNNLICTIKVARPVSEQGQLQPRCHSENGLLTNTNFPCSTIYPEVSSLARLTLKCLWSENYFDIISKFNDWNTQFQNFRCLQQKMLILRSGKVELFYLQKLTWSAIADAWQVLVNILKVSQVPVMHLLLLTTSRQPVTT